MNSKHKKGAWLMLVSFLLSSFLPPFSILKDNIAQAATVSGYSLEGIAFYASTTAETNMVPVYRLYKSSTTDHIYTTSEEEKSNAINKLSYVLEPAGTDGISFYVYPDNILAGTQPGDNNIVAGTAPQDSGNIAAGTDPQNNITSGTSPQNDILSGTAPQDSGSSNVPDGIAPVYRLYNQSFGSRLYTTSKTERDNALNNLSFALDPENSTDGIAFYAYPDDISQDVITKNNLVPIYKLYNSANGDYLYTASETEKNNLTAEAPAPPASPNLGPEISVGLWSNNKDGLHNSPFKIKANKNYNVKDVNGNILAQVTGSTITYVSSYTSTTIVHHDDGGGHKKHKKKKKKKKKKHKKKKKKKKKHAWYEELYKSIIPTAYADDEVVKTEYLSFHNPNLPEKQSATQTLYFDSTDGDNSDMLFDIYRPGSSFDQYRGKIKVQYTDDDNIWIINILPMEQYVWGMGEIAGTGPKEHSKVMTTIFRTYGYWYIENATKYVPYGFRIRSDSGSQIYYGYDWEKDHSGIKQAAQETSGKVVTYKKDTALTPYSSWTDGRTRSFEERWGSDDYPWCQSVPDPYGKDSSRTTDQLVSAGNHMVGLSAHGSLKLAGSDYKWDYQKILKYYYTGIDLTSKY